MSPAARCAIGARMTDSPARWQFWIDRGGTFTDVVAREPGGAVRTAKLLSEDPAHYRDAAIDSMDYVLASHPLGQS